MPVRSALLIAAILATAPNGLSAETPLHVSIDAGIESACSKRGIRVSEIADDAEFLRRVYLDLTGLIPTAAEAKAFLDCGDDDKRARLIDRLLDSPEYPLHMSRVFDVMLIERRIATIKSYDVSTDKWRAYLADSFAANKSWRRLVGEILSSDGTDENTGPAAKFVLVRDTEPHPLTRDVGRLFLGIDLQCAQCHDDPRYEDYRQADYYGIYAFLSRVQHFRDEQAKRSLIQEKAAGNVEFTSAFTGMQDRTNPRLPGAQMLGDPQFEKGQEYHVAPAKGVRAVPKYSRRVRLAERLPRPETRGFSRNIANRLWMQMMGRGLVHPPDLAHAQNPPSHPELLTVLARHLENTDYDIKSFLQQLALSRTYQRSSQAAHRPVAADAFATAPLRPLSPEQLGWSVLQATGYLSQQLREAEPAPPTDESGTDKNWKTAVYLQGESLANEFVSRFQGLPGQPDGNFQPSVDQTLFLSNGERMVTLLSANGETMLDRLCQFEESDATAEYLYLTLLSRYPTAAEKSEIQQRLVNHQDAPSRVDTLRQLVWGLLLSAEFRLNH